MKNKITVLEGIIAENPHGDWSDVDKGLFIGSDRIFSAEDIWRMPHIFDDLGLVGKRVRITIEEVEEN